MWIFVLLLRGTGWQLQQGPRQDGQYKAGPHGPRVQRAGCELHASKGKTGEGIEYDSVNRGCCSKWSPAAGWDSCLEPNDSDIHLVEILYTHVQCESGVR